MKSLFRTPLLSLAGLTLSLASANAAGVFSENFEGYGNTDDLNISTYDKFPPLPTGWVAGNQGFGGNDQGLNLVGSNTVYSFRYTNSGLTTAVGVIGALTAGEVYTVTFDVSQDNGGAAPYNVSLVTFNGAARNDVRSNTGATSTLANASGSASASGNTIILTYTADGTESVLGHDVAIRIFGATTSANYDNFTVDVAVPEPTAALLGSLGLLALLRRRRS